MAGFRFYVVDAREVGVVLRMGSFNRVSDSGLQWHAPYPFEKVEIVTLTEVRSVEVGYRGNAKNRIPEESLMLTEDQNIIDVQLSVQYDVKDPKAFLFNNAASDRDARILSNRPPKPPSARWSAAKRWILCSTKAAPKWRRKPPPDSANAGPLQPGRAGEQGQYQRCAAARAGAGGV